MTQSFVHLHCHTHYSLLDGASRVPELVERVKSLGMNSAAITDHGNLYGALEFYRECKASGVNPIIGYEAYVAPARRNEREARRRGDAGFHLTLLAKNRTGFRNLIKMASTAFLDGYHYVPRIDKELLEAHKDGLICLSGCASSEFSELILKDQIDEATRVAEGFHRLFGKDFYVEIQDNGLDIQKLCAQGAITIADRLGLPLVATCDAHYLTRDDAAAHDVLLCINTGRLRSDENRMRYGSDEFYVKPPEEMYAAFPKHAEAVKRSQEIADGVGIDLDFKARHFPVFTPPKKKTPEQYLRELCEEGLTDRYGPNPPEAARARLEHELGVICRMGFASYFLIVWDFVRFAREQGIPATARGSGCGAIVSYVLKLSHVCPLEYDLLFERFLDPNRSEAPDIDIDFCQDRRELVIQYVKEKYGHDSVAQIATFGTLAAKAALKDVGRVLDVPLERVNTLTKLVPVRLGVTLDDALKEVPDFRQQYEHDPLVHEWVDIARKLEGTNRNAGTHAAGVVIANGAITDYVPVHRPPRKGDDSGSKAGESVVTTQWVMGDLEKVGMLKMDFLGLRNLTVLDNAVKLIKKTRGLDLDPQTLALDDAKTYQLLQRGDAKGVFQLESDGIRELLKRMKPDNIRDLIAVLALYRPGPLGGGMVDSYVNRKHGREKWDYPHPVLKEILDETYGVMTYQEQIMRILNRLGGIELARAYACIKAISKKKHDVIDAGRVEFVKGARERGVSKETAEEIYGLIVYFGGYGFNKCVSASTVVTDARTGERTTVGSLFDERRPFEIHSLGDSGKLRPRQVTDVVWNGRKPVFDVRTAQGKVIRATANHPFRTLDGWTNLGDLKPGDRIATPRRLVVPATRSWPRHELIAYAGLLSEGNTCHPTCLYFYGNDRALVDDFAAAVIEFSDTAARVYARPGGRRLEVCVNTGRDTRFAPGHRPWHARSDGGCTVAEAPPARSGAFRWAERLGILRKKATEKAIHPELFRLRDEDLELFLGRLWAGDGFVGSAGQMPYYATSSRQLAVDVQHLLLRLGIVSGVRHKTFAYRGQSRDGYTVHVVGDDSVRAFADRILPHALGREAQVEAYRAYLASLPPDRSSKDTVPAEVRRQVDGERRKAGLTWVELEERSGQSMVEFQKKSSLKRGFRRATVARLADFFGSERLRQVAESDVFWDTVVSVEPAGEEDTFDLTVDVDHNFVADGLIVHNSHTAAYAQIGYQTAYLKAHYTAEYMAALLSSEIDDGNKRDVLVDHIEDARRLGVPVRAPDVNEGEPDFTVTDGQIVFGLTAIKGVGRGAVEDICRARAEKGPFRDLFDFCERVDLRTVPRSAIERLIKAGAMDRFSPNRAALFAALPRALQSAGEIQQDRKRGQRNIFDVLDGDGAAEAAKDAGALPDVPDWPSSEKLKYEKEALDFYFSSHPLAQHEGDLRRYAGTTVEQLPHLDDGQEVLLGGMLTQVRFMNTKRPGRNGNSRYVRCKLMDFTGLAECMMWPDEFARFKDEFADDRICFVKGVVEHKGEEPIVVLTRAFGIETAKKEMTKGVVLALSLDEHQPLVIDKLSRVLRKWPGRCPVYLQIRDAAGRKVMLRCEERFWVNPAEVAAAELELVLGGPGRVVFTGK